MTEHVIDKKRTYKNPKGRRGTEVRSPWCLASFFSLFAGLVLFVGMLAFSNGAEARQAVANSDQVAASDCSREIYTGLSSRASSERCNDLFFVPTSAAIKCGLYLDAGYPSTLMRKACQLYDRGAIEFFLEDTSAEK